MTQGGCVALEVKIRSAVEAPPISLSGWATVIVSAVDSPDLAIERPSALPGRC